MTQLLASVLSFAFGLLFLPMVFRGMRVTNTGSALKTGLAAGVASVFMGKGLLVLLRLVFLPIVLLGPLGAFLVQFVVNAILVQFTSRLGSSVEFDGFKTGLAAAVALTALQTLVLYIV